MACARMMSLLQGRGALLCFLCILGMSVLICASLFYTLIVNGGLFIDTDTKKVGFFTFCLWNGTVEKLTCLQQSSDLEALGIAYPKAVVFGSVFAYVSLPVCLFILLTLVFAWLLHSRPTWKLAMGLSALAYLSLSIGIGMFLLFAGTLINVSELGYGFLVSVLAVIMLLLQGVAALRLLPLFKKQDSPEDKV